MTEIQIDTAEIVETMKELFPKEYTICLQRVHIVKLQAMVEEKSNEVTELS